MTLIHRTRLNATILAMIVAFGIGGCRSSGEPLGLLLRGTFVLRTVNGGPLPADISSQPSYQTTLLADTLRFEGKGLATLGRTVREQYSTFAPTVDHWTADFAVRIVGETVYLQFLCPPGADCVIGGPIAAHLVDASTLTLGDSYVYVRP